MPRAQRPANSATTAGTDVVEQHWDPARYQRNAGFVAVLGQPVLELLAPKRGERILDLGCGDGALTALLAETADVIAVDAAAAQVAAARARGLDARIKDGAGLDFDQQFDAVFSNAALHWMRDPDRVIDGVWRALKPGGRFVAECGGVGNVERVRAALAAVLVRRRVNVERVNPWYFPAPDEYRLRLERRGFVVQSMTLLPRPTTLPGTLADWLDTFAESFLATVPDSERAAVKAEVETMLTRDLRDEAGVWTADYVRLRFAALKPSGAMP